MHQNQLEGVKKIEHPDIKGVYDIEYRLKVEIKDYRGQGTGKFKFEPKEGKEPLRKTIYDPKIISNDEIVKLGKEAMEDGLNKNQVESFIEQEKQLIQGTSSSGLKFEGIKNKNTGEIENFWPVLEFREIK